MSFQLILVLYVAGALVAMWLAQARGYWWPIGLALGALLGPVAPIAALILPNRKRRRSAPR